MEIKNNKIVATPRSKYHKYLSGGSSSGSSSGGSASIDTNNFVKKIGELSQTVEGDFIVNGNIISTGEVSAYGAGSGSGSGTSGSLGGLVNVGIWADEIPTSDRVMVQLAGATHWSSKLLSEIVGLDTVALDNYLTTNQYATQSYVTTKVAELVGTAPETLNTLNELAAALGNDPNFATSISTLIGTKWTQDNTKIGNWDSAYSHISDSVKHITGTERTNWNSAYSALHSHTNKTVLDGVTSKLITNWNTAFTNNHTHSNKSIIDNLTQANLDVLARLSVVDGNLKVDTNFWSTGEVSAYGAGVGTGGGGGLISSVFGSAGLGGSYLDSDLTNTFNAYTINLINTNLTSALGRIGTLETSTPNVAWGTATGQYSPLTINSVSRNLSLDGHTHSQYLTSYINNYLTGVSGSGNGTITFTRNGLTDLTFNAAHTHSYLPLSGGTMTRYIDIDTPNVNGGSFLRFKRNGVNVGYVGDGSAGANASVELCNYISSKSLSLNNDGILRYGGNFVYHAGNIPTWNQNTTGTAGSTTLLMRIGDHRNGFRPYDIPAKGLVQTFATQGAFLGQQDDGNYSDVIAISSYQDASAGLVNVLSFDKSTARINHFMGVFGTATWTGYKTLAYITDNVASATKLANARTIWGASFDGTSNVSGNIDLQNSDILGYGGARIIQGLTGHLGFNPTGNVLIGTILNSGHKLNVNGSSRIGNSISNGLTIWNGTTGVTLTVDIDGNLKIDGNIYATGEVSAYGAGSGTGGESGLISSVIGSAGLGGSYLNSDLTNTFNAYTINLINSNLTSALGRIGTLETNTPNVVWGTATSQYSPLTINSVSRNLSLDGHTHSYLPLSGGNLTGALTINTNTVWHSGNDGAGSGLDADTLDGLHSSDLAKALANGSVDLNTINGFGILANFYNSNATEANHYPIAQAGTLFYGTAAYSSANQIYGSFSSNRWFARGGGSDASVKTPWREFAFTDSNVASATYSPNSSKLYSTDETYKYSGNTPYYGYITYNNGLNVWDFKVSPNSPENVRVYMSDRLTNTRTIWGQNFNGEGNVSGNLSGATTGTFSSTVSATTGIFSNLTANYIPKHTAGGLANSLIYDNGTNVGINTSSPSSMLSVYSSEYKQIEIKGAGAQKLYFGSVADSVGSYVQNNSYYYGSFLFKPKYTTSSGIHFDSDGSLWLSTNNGLTVDVDFEPTKRLTVLYNGNVGINTSSPSYKLDVNGTFRTAGIAYFGNNLRIQDSGSYSELIGGAGKSIKFYTNDCIYNPLNLFSSGNVGVNTATDAGYKLDVNGTFRVNSNYSTTFTGNDINFTRASGDSYITAASVLNLGGGNVMGTIRINASNVFVYKESLFGGGLRIDQTAGGGVGISLFGESALNPNYGLMFAQTNYRGKHGAVTGDWATYFTMSPDAGRGWIFTSNAAGTGGNVASISNWGNLTCSGEVTAYSASDIRLKTNIKPIVSAIDVINKLNPVSYNWNEKAKELNQLKGDSTEYGLIAQELEEVLPELVHPIYNGEYKSIDYVKIVPLLIGAIKELQLEINELKNK